MPKLELHVVTGNPGAGKTTMVGLKATDGDIVLDFDRLAMAAGSTKKRGHAPQHLGAARIMWGALGRALPSMQGRVWLIHGYPSAEAEKRYRDLGATFHRLDGGTPRKDPKDYGQGSGQGSGQAIGQRSEDRAGGTAVLELPPAVQKKDPYVDEAGKHLSLLRPSGSTRAWRKLRAEVLEAANYRCGYCGARATTVDHIKSRVNGGTDARSNLIASCWECNLAKGGRKRGT